MKSKDKPDHPVDATEEDKKRIQNEFNADLDFKRKNKIKGGLPPANA